MNLTACGDEQHLTRQSGKNTNRGFAQLSFVHNPCLRFPVVPFPARLDVGSCVCAFLRTWERTVVINACVCMHEVDTLAHTCICGYRTRIYRYTHGPTIGIDEPASCWHLCNRISDPISDIWRPSVHCIWHPNANLMLPVMPQVIYCRLTGFLAKLKDSR